MVTVRNLPNRRAAEEAFSTKDKDLASGACRADEKPAPNRWRDLSSWTPTSFVSRHITPMYHYAGSIVDLSRQHHHYRVLISLWLTKPWARISFIKSETLAFKVATVSRKQIVEISLSPWNPFLLRLSRPDIPSGKRHKRDTWSISKVWLSCPQ